MQAIQSQQKQLIDQCHAMIINQEKISQETFNAYLRNVVNYDVCDAISDMICDYFFAAFERKQHLFYYI